MNEDSIMEFVVAVVFGCAIVAALGTIYITKRTIGELTDREVREVKEGFHNCIVWVDEYTQPIYLWATWWEKHPPVDGRMSVSELRGISSIRTYVSKLKLHVRKIQVILENNRMLQFNITKE